MNQTSTKGPKRLLVNRPHRAALQHSLVTALERLAVPAGSVLCIRCEAIEAAAANSLLEIVREWLASIERDDVLVLLMPGERFELATLDPAELERWGYVRRDAPAMPEGLRQLRDAAQHVRDRGRLLADDLREGRPVDTRPFKEALAGFITTMNRVLPEDEA